MKIVKALIAAGIFLWHNAAVAQPSPKGMVGVDWTNREIRNFDAFGDFTHQEPSDFAIFDDVAMVAPKNGTTISRKTETIQNGKIASSGVTLPTGDALPARLLTVPCPEDLATISGVSCYTLVVPENRQSGSTRMIELPIVVRRATHPDGPQTHALLYSVGGPGSDTMYRIEHKVQNVPLLTEHDVVWFEQRGTGGARPALECPEYTAAHESIAERNLPIGVATRIQVAAAKTCRAKLEASGIDLGAYNTSETANDIADLRGLLGYKNFDLYGVSYSGSVMLAVVRDHPGVARSLFLDSPLPPDVNYDEVGISNAQHALENVFADCDADLKCSAVYKGGTVAMAHLIEKLQARPLRVVLKSTDGVPLPFAIDGRAAQDAVDSLMFDPDSVGAIPQLVFSALAGDNRLLIQAVQENIGKSFYAWGDRISVWCHDFAPFDRTLLIARELAQYPRLRGLDPRTVPPEVCAAWNVGAQPVANHRAVQSTVPALIFAGEYDPAVAPQWGIHVMESLPNSTFVRFPGMSHGAGETTCGWSIFAQFVDDPQAKLDLTCASRFLYARFVTPQTE